MQEKLERAQRQGWIYRGSQGEYEGEKVKEKREMEGG